MEKHFHMSSTYILTLDPPYRLKNLSNYLSNSRPQIWKLVSNLRPQLKIGEISSCLLKNVYSGTTELTFVWYSSAMQS